MRTTGILSRDRSSARARLALVSERTADWKEPGLSHDHATVAEVEYLEIIFWL